MISSALAILSLLAAQDLVGKDFTESSLHEWRREPREFQGAQADGGKLVLSAGTWSSVVAPGTQENFEASLTFTILDRAKRFSYQTLSDWGVWSDFGTNDEGYELGVLLRHGPEGGYRVQVSEKFQEISLLSYPKGSFLRVAPSKIRAGAPQELRIVVQGNRIRVTLDGEEKFDYLEECVPRPKGAFGLATSSSAKVAVENVRLTPLPAAAAEAPRAHVAKFSAREWRDRTWIFDGQEPILQVFTPGFAINHNVKLKPGFRAMLIMEIAWNPNSEQDYKEEVQTLTPPRITTQGEALQVAWEGRHPKGLFGSQVVMTVTYDAKRGFYSYDIDRTLEMAPGKEFDFKRGFVFEHHAPTDPFCWKYLIFRREDGEIYYRPVTHYYDPGPFPDAALTKGFRAWVERIDGNDLVSPAVEYEASTIPWPTGSAGFAVCAWGYDTGIGFPSAVLKDGARLRLKYRYTGYPAEEMKARLAQAKIYPIPSLDPTKHFILAPGWPKVDFSKFVKLSEWRPYESNAWLSGHNVVPRYALEKASGFGNGFALKLGPADQASVCLRSPGPLPKGNYLVSAHAKGMNLHGPGPYVSVLRMKAHPGDAFVRMGTVLGEVRHYLGAGTFDWKTVGFVLELAEDTPALAIELGNPGTGNVLFGDLEILPLSAGQSVPEGISLKPRTSPPVVVPVPEGALADYRMEEGEGLYGCDEAQKLFGHLQLANLDWTVDEGRPALRFSDNTTGRRDFPRTGTLWSAYLGTRGYVGRETVPAAVAGSHGGNPVTLNGLTISTFVKPDRKMGDSRCGDVVGLGARRFILSLYGSQAPYRLGLRVNANPKDEFVSQTPLDADRWSHVAVTAEAADGKWRIRIYQDGKCVAEGRTNELASPTTISATLVLGTELFYFHGAYYRGLIGRTTVFDRALTEEEIRACGQKRP